MGGELTVDIDPIEAANAVVLRCGGDIDAHTIGKFDAAVTGVLDEGVSRLVVDFTRVGHTSSRGLGILIAARKTLDERGGALVLLNPNEVVRESVTVLGFDSIFTIASSEEEALGTAADS